MEQRVRIKKYLAFILAFCLLLLTGFSFYKPVLINASEPFIDLSGSVGTSIGNAKEAFQLENQSGTSKPGDSEEDKPSIPSKEEKTQIEIVVCDETFLVDGVECPYFSSVNEYICRKENENCKFVLVDDYAEAETYKKVLRSLREAKRLFTESCVD
ncbi:MAG: hypothetical protein ACI4FY_00090 [Acetatifactor sp.]